MQVVTSSIASFSHIDAPGDLVPTGCLLKLRKILIFVERFGPNHLMRAIKQLSKDPHGYKLEEPEM